MLIEDILGSWSEQMGRSKLWHCVGFTRTKYQKRRADIYHFNYWKWVWRALTEGGCGNNHSIRNGDAFCHTLAAAFVTRMKNKSCGVSHLRQGGDGPRDAPQPRVSLMPVRLRPFHVTLVRAGEPQHSLLSAGEEALPWELGGVSNSRTAPAEKMR